MSEFTRPLTGEVHLSTGLRVLCGWFSGGFNSMNSLNIVLIITRKIKDRLMCQRGNSMIKEKVWNREYIEQ